MANVSDYFTEGTVSERPPRQTMVRLRTSHVGALLCIVLTLLEGKTLCQFLFKYKNVLPNTIFLFEIAGIPKCSAQQTQPQVRQKCKYPHNNSISHSYQRLEISVNTTKLTFRSLLSWEQNKNRFLGQSKSSWKYAINYEIILNRRHRIKNKNLAVHHRFITHPPSTRLLTVTPSANTIHKRQSFTYKQWKLTTPLSIVMRGDQQPPNDDADHDDDPEFYPLGDVDYRYHVLRTSPAHTVGREGLIHANQQLFQLLFFVFLSVDLKNMLLLRVLTKPAVWPGYCK